MTGAPRPSMSPGLMDLPSRAAAEAVAGGMATVVAEGEDFVAGVMGVATASAVVAEEEGGGAEEVMAGEALAGEALAGSATSAVKLDTWLKIATREAAAAMAVAVAEAAVLAITVVKWVILLEIATRAEAEAEVGGMEAAAEAVEEEAAAAASPAITVARRGTLLGSALAGTDNGSIFTICINFLPFYLIP